MPIPKVKNPEYARLVNQAIFDAVTKVSSDEGSKTSFLMAGEVIQACLTMIAMTAAPLEGAKTAKDRREIAEECAKIIRSRTTAFREQFDAGKMPWIDVVTEKDKH